MMGAAGPKELWRQAQRYNRLLSILQELYLDWDWKVHGGGRFSHLDFVTCERVAYSYEEAERFLVAKKTQERCRYDRIAKKVDAYFEKKGA